MQEAYADGGASWKENAEWNPIRKNSAEGELPLTPGMYFRFQSELVTHANGYLIRFSFRSWVKRRKRVCRGQSSQGIQQKSWYSIASCIPSKILKHWEVCLLLKGGVIFFSGVILISSILFFFLDLFYPILYQLKVFWLRHILRQMRVS